MADAKRDNNQVPTLIAISSADGLTPVILWADPVTHRLLVDLPSGAGTGTVTSVSIVTANGISGSVATATTTPAITLTLGAITPTSVNGLTLAAQTNGFTIAGGSTSKTLTVPLDASVSGTNTGDQDLSGYLLKSEFNANTILYATTDNTPVALTVGEQTIVGRITGGEIKALSATEVRTLINVADGANAYVHPNHSGDVTSVADGAQTIANSAVTYAKIQNVSAAAKVLGRKTAGAGVVEELDIDTDLSSVSANDDTVPSAKATKAYADLMVPKTLFDANTILAATSDNTPAAVEIAEQKILGRVTGGNIAAIAIDSDLSSVSANDDTVPSAKATKAMGDLKLALAGGTMTGAINLGENAGLEFDAALSADGKYSGLVRAGTAGAALAFGDLVYLAAADSRWELADADAASTSGDVMLGICVLAATGDGEATKVLMIGFVRADTAFPTLTIGAPAYVSTTAGDIQTAQPTGEDDVIRRVGFAWTADELFFNPSNDYITHTA